MPGILKKTAGREKASEEGIAAAFAKRLSSDTNKQAIEEFIRKACIAADRKLKMAFELKILMVAATAFAYEQLFGESSMKDRITMSFLGMSAHDSMEIMNISTDEFLELIPKRLSEYHEAWNAPNPPEPFERIGEVYAKHLSADQPFDALTVLKGAIWFENELLTVISVFKDILDKYEIVPLEKIEKIKTAVIYDTINDAIKEDDLEDVKRHIKNGEEVNAKDVSGWTPLHWAASRNNVKIAKALIDSGADLKGRTGQGWTPLHAAIFPGDLAVTELLIGQGADVNAKGDQGETPLHLAALNGLKEKAAFLIANGADINATLEIKKEGDETGPIGTPLTWTNIFGMVDVAELLISKGADFKSKLAAGNTLLHLAAIGGHSQYARMLIEHGADINAINDEGRTPLRIAKEKRNRYLIKLLKKHGARSRKAPRNKE